MNIARRSQGRETELTQQRNEYKEIKPITPGTKKYLKPIFSGSFKAFTAGNGALMRQGFAPDSAF